jgi:hypothetical protein
MGVFPPAPARTGLLPQSGNGVVNGTTGNRTIPGAAPGTTAARPINGFRPMGGAQVSGQGQGQAQAQAQRPIGVQPSLLQASSSQAQAQAQTGAQQARPANELPVQRGRDAVLFAAVETMDL